MPFTMYTGGTQGPGGWSWARPDLFMEQPGCGAVWSDDFMVDSTAFYTVVGTNTPTLAIPTVAVEGGTVIATSQGNANDELTVSTDNSAGLIQNTTDLYFDMRLNVDNITTASMTMGIIDELDRDNATNWDTTYTHALGFETGDTNFVGFSWMSADDADGLWASYRATGDSGITRVQTTAADFNIVASEWFRVSLRIEAGAITWYINGAPLSDMSVTIADTGITSGTVMCPFFSLVESGTDGPVAEVDFFQFAWQKNPSTTAV